MPNPAISRPAGRRFQYIRFALRLRVPLAVAMIGVAIFGAIASFIGVDPLLRPLDGRSATHPITAMCLIALGVGILQTRRYGQSSHWCRVVLGTVVFLCAARLMEAILSGAAGAMAAGVFDPVAGFSGRFSVEAAMTLGAFALAGLVRHGNGRWGGVFLVAGLGTVFTTLIQLSFGLTFFNGDVGAFTLFGMGLSSLAILSVYIHRPFVRAIFLLGDVGSQTRVMAAAIVAIPWGAGLVLDRVGDGLAPLETGMISIITGSMLVILMSTSARHESSVAARRRAEREIAMQSRVDPLTGALNRFGMTEVVEGAWLDFKSSGAQFGMILVDLEYFRRLDATFGQGDGEGVLARVAATLQPQLRATDALGRWGADEFLVLLKIKDHANIAIVADRLRHALADATKPFCAALEVVPSTIEVPFGICTLRDEDDAPTDAITRADAALHLAKTSEDDLAVEVTHGERKAA